MLRDENLKLIEDAPSAVDAFSAVLDALVSDQTISADVAGNVKNALIHQREVLEPRILANLTAQGDAETLRGAETPIANDGYAGYGSLGEQVPTE